MDNRQILIQDYKRENFDLAIKLIFDEDTATHYIDHPESGLVFLWSEDKSVNSIKLPISLSWKSAAELAWEWLKAQPRERYKQGYDGDGSSEYGFKISNEKVYMIADSRYGICAVQPIWAWHSK